MPTGLVLCRHFCIGDIMTDYPKRVFVPRASRIYEERREQLTLRLTEDLAQRARNAAKMRGLSLTDWLESAVKNNLKN